MAFIYKYKLRDKKEREEINLADYKEAIEQALIEIFKSNLKEVFVEKVFFEFKLYVSVEAKVLRSLGKNIKRKGVTTEYGFIREKILLYAVVESIAEDRSTISLDFIDSSIKDKNRFIEKTNSFATLKGIDDFPDPVKRNYYLDVYNGEIDYEHFKYICGVEKIQEDDTFFLRVAHKHFISNLNTKQNRNYINLENIVDYDYLSDENSMIPTERNDYFEIDMVKYVDKDDFQKITSILNYGQLLTNPLGIQQIESKLEDLEEKTIVFSVHNVGQALATSFANEEEKPFLYFDFGLPYGNNSHTLPASVDLRVSSQTMIVLSHMHKDHWFGLNTVSEAFKCSWYIPKQMKSLFKHRIAEIIKCGGKVYELSNNITNKKFNFSLLQDSKRKPGRLPKYKHETGIVLFVSAKDLNGKDFNIFIPGDQDYDYINQSLLKDINCLVACHHGGKYSWTSKATLPIPDANNNVIIYSYGSHNKCNHPSKTAKYENNGWKNAHCTSTMGTYEIKIHF